MRSFPLHGWMRSFNCLYEKVLKCCQAHDCYNVLLKDVDYVRTEVPPAPGCCAALRTTSLQVAGRTWTILGAAVVAGIVFWQAPFEMLDPKAQVICRRDAHAVPVLAGVRCRLLPSGPLSAPGSSTLWCANCSVACPWPAVAVTPRCRIAALVLLPEGDDYGRRGPGCWNGARGAQCVWRGWPCRFGVDRPPGCAGSDVGVGNTFCNPIPRGW